MERFCNRSGALPAQPRLAIGLDRLAPQADAGERVRRHVKRVRGGWSYGCVALGSPRGFRCERGIVVRVNDVMRQTRVLGLLLPEPLEQRPCLLLAGVRFV